MERLGEARGATSEGALLAVTLLLAALLAALIVAPLTVGAQRPTFAPTLFWDSGLINVPAAYASPLGGDLAFSFARLSLDSASLPPLQARAASYDLSLTASLWGRAEVGVSVFSGDLKTGLFAKLLLVDQSDGIWRRGLVHWMPSVAVGMRNAGPEKSLNRLALSGTAGFSTSPSVFAVATRTFALRAADDTGATRPKTQLSLTAGFGTGLFKDDGALGARYAASATGGAFGGASFDIATGRYSTFSILAEHDAWALNAGVRAEIRGLRIAIFAMELGASADEGTAAAPGTSPAAPNGGAYASQKIALSIGWQTHMLTLVRGNRLEQQTARLEQAQGDLVRQVRFAQQRIDVIGSQIDALRAIASEEKNMERAELEKRLREEQDALRRLQELIKAREAVKKP